MFFPTEASSCASFVFSSELDHGFLGPSTTMHGGLWGVSARAAMPLCVRSTGSPGGWTGRVGGDRVMKVLV
jgi:hypothetical protein